MCPRLKLFFFIGGGYCLKYCIANAMLFLAHCDLSEKIVLDSELNDASTGIAPTKLLGRPSQCPHLATRLR